MKSLFQDRPFGFWLLAKTLGFSLVAVTAFALAMGMNSAMLSAIHYSWQGAVAGPQALGEREQIPQASEPEGKAILVWKVGDPHTGTIPDTKVPLDLELSAEKIGYKLNIKSFPAEGFAETLSDALQGNQEPDILAVTNYGTIDEITGSFKGTGGVGAVREALTRVTQSLTELQGRQQGWEYLLSTSNNYEAAKQLALRSPECNSSGESSPLPEDLRTIGTPIARAYIQGEADSLKAFEDAEILHTVANREPPRRGPLILSSPPVSPGQVSEIKDCGYWGNDHLAFARMVASYESARTLGRLAVLLVLRKQQSQWQLLAASTDPASNTMFLHQIPRLVSLLQKEWTPGSNPAPAKLLAPEDGRFPQPASGQRFGDFIWQPSTSSRVIAEIAEFAYKNDARLFIRFASEDSVARGQVSTGYLWGGDPPWNWKWRVWSISDDGAVSFSQARSFQN